MIHRSLNYNGILFIAVSREHACMDICPQGALYWHQLEFFICWPWWWLHIYLLYCCKWMLLYIHTSVNEQDSVIWLQCLLPQIADQEANCIIHLLKNGSENNQGLQGRHQKGTASRSQWFHHHCARCPLRTVNAQSGRPFQDYLVCTGIWSFLRIWCSVMTHRDSVTPL